MARLGLLLGAVAVMLAVMPRTDHQSYSYELNQPWKYPLLTAPADMPILRDSATTHRLRDSIDRNFVHIIKFDDRVAGQSVYRFSKAAGAAATPAQMNFLKERLAEVYQRGIIPTPIYEAVQTQNHGTLREAVVSDEDNAMITIDATQMLSPAKAFQYIDSIYSAQTEGSMAEELSNALSYSLVPNIVVDTGAEKKFLQQEYINVDGALGVIKKGQRIVDRGEIITPQIFTNLNTYQELLRQQDEDKQKRTFYTIGQGLYIAICLALFYLFLFVWRPNFFRNIRMMTFLMSYLSLFEVFAVVMFEYFHSGLYLVPFAAVPVVITVFADSRTAIFSLLISVLITAMVATFQFQFIFLQTVAGALATLSLRRLSRRSQLLSTGAITFAAYSLCYFAFCLVTDGDLEQFEWKAIGAFAVNAVLMSFSYILIVIVEKIYGFTSTVTLVELSDINNPLLRRLAEDAPGTFQHSMQVSTLGAEAARAVGANTLLVRTGALYHDIGKLESPVFFTENQHGVNPHAGLDPETSAQKIISHVTYGLQLAQKAKLPQVIRNFITEHHGKGLTRYFYNTAVNENPDKVIDKAPFQYPGPNPQSKETTILMMADAVEAASRSLKDYSEKSVSDLVDRIIDSQEKAGLYKDSPLSFKDIETVKATFKKRLGTIYHGRVAYPELKSNPAAAAPSTDVKPEG